MRRTRVFGATGTVLMAIGALALAPDPVVQDPTFGVRLLNLPSRIQTVSLTMTTTGAVDDGARVADARPLRPWQPADVPQPAGPHAAAVGAAPAHRAADVQQGRLLLPGAESDRPPRAGPLPGGTGDRAGARPRVHPVGAEPVAEPPRRTGRCSCGSVAASPRSPATTSSPRSCFTGSSCCSAWD